MATMTKSRKAKSKSQAEYVYLATRKTGDQLWVNRVATDLVDVMSADAEWAATIETFKDGDEHFPCVWVLKGSDRDPAYRECIEHWQANMSPSDDR